MVKVKEDLTGKIFGRLTVLGQADDYIQPNGQHAARWLCKCECGNDEVIVLQSSLKQGDTTSCGCYAIEQTIKRSKKYNVWMDDVFSDEHGEYKIGITNNTNVMFYVDLDDYDKVKDICWCEHIVGKTHRLEGNNGKKNVIMHQFLGFKNYDHIDRNELNNRKYNLRPCTKSQNNINQPLRSDNASGLKGVSWSCRNQKWFAQITINYEHFFLGYFEKKEDAIAARLKAEYDLYGDFSSQKELFRMYGLDNNAKE